MIIHKTDNIIKTGCDNSNKATINQDKLSKLQYILTSGLYQDPIGSTINEWTANAIDSKRRAKSDIPVIVSITDDKLSIKDNGLGLSKDDFINICMNYLTSTKEDNDDDIGFYGLGLKSFLSLERSATFIIVKDNIECKFISYQGDEFMEYDLIYEKETTELNGVICEIAIKDRYEKTEFIDKAKSKLAYYDEILLYIDNIVYDKKIIRSEEWQYSRSYDSGKLHICLKDVVYPINFDVLKIKPIYIPIALKFNLNSGIRPTPSRESIIYDKKTKDLILNKIKTVANIFVDKYNLIQNEEKSYIEAYNSINDSNAYISFNDIELQINDFEKYANTSFNQVKVKGLVLKSAEYYKNIGSTILDEYNVVVDNKSMWKTKNICKYLTQSNIINSDSIKYILVKNTPSRKVKSYFQSKYSNAVYIIKSKNRKLGKCYDSTDSTNYRFLLNLSLVDKSLWRDRIKEFEFVKNQFVSLFIDERNVENSKEFIEYCQSIKKEKPKYLSNYKTLNKEKGDVTLGMLMPKYIGNGYKIEKTIFKIETFHKNPYLTIVFFQEDKELALEYKYCFAKSNIKIAIIGKNEYNKIKNKHNIMTKSEFENSKVFKRLASSLLFEELLDTFEELYNQKSHLLIKSCILKFESNIKLLQDYVSKNKFYINNDDLKNSINAIAKENNLYDFSLWDIYLDTKKDIEKYKFIRLFKNPVSYDKDGLKEINTIINQMLLFKKIYYNEFKDFDIVTKEQPVSVPENQLELQFN